MSTLHPVDQTVLRSIRAIVDYDYATERRDYESTHPNDREGHVFGHLERVSAWLKDADAKRAEFVHVVEVFERVDGVFVFEDLADAQAFENTINAGRDASLGPACSRTEESVNDHAEALRTIAAECEASAEAEAASLEIGCPIAAYAWKKGEDAPYPDKLNAVEYTCYPVGSEEGDGQQPRKFTLWVGLDPDADGGAVHVDAGRVRLESEGWEVVDWGAA